MCLFICVCVCVCVCVFPVFSPAIIEAQPGSQKLEEAQGSSLMLTPVSETSSLDTLAHLSPQVSPSSGQSESVIDSLLPAPEPEIPEPPKSEGDPPSTDEEKDPKKSPKQHLHCPVCKITVNSTSQLDAHFTGTAFTLLERPAQYCYSNVLISEH